MTPAARLSAAIELLDQILDGEPAERALTRWARQSRFAGSKDRAAVRDVVFDCLRQRRSLAHYAGAETGRALVAAQQKKSGEDIAALFTGDKFAPAPLSDAEITRLGHPDSDPTLPEEFDFPDFLLPELLRSLGNDLPQVMSAMQERAPVDLRVNSLKASVEEAERMLARDLIFTERLATTPNTLRIIENPRKLAASLAYSYGLVELQDASSQKIAEFAGAEAGQKVLDFCAGGGGKTLALAADMEGEGTLIAHDVNPHRMKDLPERARRAGADVQLLTGDMLRKQAMKCDLVLVDAPCSGTGAWRRNPDAKWRLDQRFIDKTVALQAEILDEAAVYVKQGGNLVYATCSILQCENQDQVAAFVKRHGWTLEDEIFLTPLTGGDGFYGAKLRRN